MNSEIRILTEDEITDVSGGFACGGLCVLGAFGAAAGLGASSVAIGRAIGDATN